MALTSLFHTPFQDVANLSFTTFAVTLPILGVLCLILYRAFFHPLSHVPGPLICRITSLWTYAHSYIGDECTLISTLHESYGPVVRIAPNEVVIADGAALAPIYSEKGGFRKADCYRNFDIDGFASLFSELDKEQRAPRAKSVLPLFSSASLRDGEDALESCVRRLVDRLQADKERCLKNRGQQKEGETRPTCNVLDLGRSLAVDAVSAYLFRRTYGGLDEGRVKTTEGEMNQLSASEFVNAFVGVGRFFYLPNWIFVAFEKVSGWAFDTQETLESISKVNAFVNSVVEEAKMDENTYQARMLRSGLSKSEVAAQCKDLMFAGTDSSGMNLSSLCWHLSRNPEIYAEAREEINHAQERNPAYEPASLPYLRSCIREALRLSMANPTRLPRVVPDGGWTFHCKSSGGAYYFPGRTLVSCQIHTLHHNATVFPDPTTFKPERWIETPHYTPSSEMTRDLIPFSLGSRQCIARNLAMMELTLASRAIIRSGVLDGAQAIGDKVEILEWFNSKVKGEAIELSWS